MSNPFKIFKLRKEERWLAAVALIVFVVFNALLVVSHWGAWTLRAEYQFDCYGCCWPRYSLFVSDLLVFVIAHLLCRVPA